MCVCVCVKTSVCACVSLHLFVKGLRVVKHEVDKLQEMLERLDLPPLQHLVQQGEASKASTASKV